MFQYFKRLTIKNLVSPIGLAAVSYCFFLFGWLFPPDTYTGFLREPDTMFLDPLIFIFFTACVVSFLVGVNSASYFGISTNRETKEVIFSRIGIMYFIIPMVVATVLCSTYLALLGAQFNFVGLLVSQQGGAIKDAIHSGQIAVAGPWSASLMLLTGVLWWAQYRVGQLNIKGAAKVVFYLFYFIGLLVDVATCIATVDRTNLMPLISGVIIIFLFRKSRAANVRLSSLALIGLGSIFCVGTVFLILSFLRGASALTLLATGILGYTVTPYNHLSALLHGTMHYSYEGKGVYLVSYMLEEKKIDTALGFRSMFNWPSAWDLYQSEFTSTAGSGLNPIFIWSGVFGYLYSDIGWGALVYLFIVGILASYLWAGFKEGKSASILLYLWLAFWILFWFGWNLLFDGRAATLVESGILLALYDRFFIRRSRQVEENTQGREWAYGGTRRVP